MSIDSSMLTMYLAISIAFVLGILTGWGLALSARIWMTYEEGVLVHMKKEGTPLIPASVYQKHRKKVVNEPVGKNGTTIQVHHYTIPNWLVQEAASQGAVTVKEAIEA